MNIRNKFKELKNYIKSIVPLTYKKNNLKEIKEHIQGKAPLDDNDGYMELLSYLEPYVPHDMEESYNNLIEEASKYEKVGDINNKDYEKKRDYFFERLGICVGYNNYFSSGWSYFSDEMRLGEDGKLVSTTAFLNVSEQERKVWKEREEKYENEQQEELRQNDDIDSYYEQPPIKEPAQILPEGWFWLKFYDGSGYLESPDGHRYMEYDSCTKEYKFDENDSSYGCYIEGWNIVPYTLEEIQEYDNNFFNFAEKQVIERVLNKEDILLELEEKEEDYGMEL